MFLLSSGTAVSVLALPKIMRGAELVKPAVVALAFDGEALLAAGSDLIRSDAGGSSWTTLPIPAAVLALATHREQRGRILAGLDPGGTDLSEDGGRHWARRHRRLAAGDITSVALAGGTHD